MKYFHDQMSTHVCAGRGAFLITLAPQVASLLTEIPHTNTLHSLHEPKHSLNEKYLQLHYQMERIVIIC